MYRKKDFMISLQIFDIKEIMEKLLIKESFDTFYFLEAKALTSACLTLSGKRNSGWYDDAEKELMNGMPDYLFWREAKPTLYQYIKGKKTPHILNITLKLPKEQCEEELRQKDVDFLLHFRFEKEVLLLVSGCNYHTFQMDKSADYLWDDYIKQLLKKWKISFREG